MEEIAFWNEDLEKAGRVRRETSSSDLRRPKLEAIEEKQRKSSLKRGGKRVLEERVRREMGGAKRC